MNPTSSKGEFVYTTSFGVVSLCKLKEDEASNELHTEEVKSNLALLLTPDNHKVRLEENCIFFLDFYVKDYSVVEIAKKFLIFQSSATNTVETYVLRFNKQHERSEFLTAYRLIKAVSANERMTDTFNEAPSKKKFKNDRQLNAESHCQNSRVCSSISEFDSRTEESSATQYFQFYGFLSQQQNMMQDFVRTSTYQRAILDNYEDFKNKVIMDVGAGSGILSFFAIQAAAKMVYAVEASSMAIHCQELIRTNNLFERMKVLTGKVEEIEVPEMVDMLISEPMGYMLVNERMLESYLHARRFLKPGGRMFPSQADLHFALFTDETLYLEQVQRGAFWYQENFHGVNLSALKHQALEEIFHQPVVDTWSPSILISRSVKWSIDFEKDDVEKLHKIEVPFALKVTRTCHLHGIASWFDVVFLGSLRSVWLSTAPTEPLTHWYQVRCLFQAPILVYLGQTVEGRILLTANERQSYDIEISVEIQGFSYSNKLDLKMPHFRYTNGQFCQPPGSHSECPSNVFLQTSSTKNDQKLENGVNMNLSLNASRESANLNNLLSGIPVPSTLISTNSSAISTNSTANYNSMSLGKSNESIPEKRILLLNEPSNGDFKTNECD